MSIIEITEPIKSVEEELNKFIIHAQKTLSFEDDRTKLELQFRESQVEKFKQVKKIGKEITVNSEVDKIDESTPDLIVLLDAIAAHTPKDKSREFGRIGQVIASSNILFLETLHSKIILNGDDPVALLSLS